MKNHHIHLLQPVQLNQQNYLSTKVALSLKMEHQPVKISLLRRIHVIHRILEGL